MALKFTDENFDKEVLQSDLIVFVDFYADWCGPCKMMAPVVDELAEDYDGIIKVGKLNVDESPDSASLYRVMTIPTFMLFKNGEVIESVVGGMDKSILKEKIDTYL